MAARQPQSGLNHPSSPIRNRETTPRPSISPLSAKASPVAIRDTAMNDSESNGDAIAATTMTAEIGDDDSRSSSLSEPDDDEPEDFQHLGRPAVANTVEEAPAHQSLEVDSEAETERLDQTPDKTRKQPDNVGRTPSKLSHAATAEDELSDPPSPLPVEPGAASSAGTIEAAGKTLAHDEDKSQGFDEIAGQKRKRSDTVDSSLTSAESDIGESPRKRNHSATVNDEPVVEDNSTSVEEAVEDAPEPAIVPETIDDAELETDIPGNTTIPATKVGRGRKPGKHKGKLKKDASKEEETEKPEVVVPPLEEQSEEAAAKSAEELQHKQTASAVFEDLAKQFTAFREKMYNEKLVAVDAELDLLNQPECKHPEYLRQVACVDARYQKQLSETKALHKFKLESLKRTTLGERTQLHSQYFQEARELRENVMYQLGEDWYNIQKERRQSNQEREDAYIYRFPTKKSVQIKQQAKYNQEVSVLSGVAKYVGFPAAPEIAGAEGDTLEDDLKAMKLAKRAQQPTTQQQQVYIPNRSGLIQGQSDRIAHEQFIEQNAWARPQGQFHNHGTPNLTHTPDWAAEPGAHSARHLIRNLSGGVHRASSPYTTPVPQRRVPMEQTSSATVPVNSDGAEASSAVAAPPTMDRADGSFGRDQASPLAVAKQRQNGADFAGPRNISNISGISGASTIDAPDSAEKSRLRDAPTQPQVFDPSQLGRNGFEPKRQHEMYANALFRPPRHDGALPLQGPGVAQ